jgi:hypothetical protein
MRTCIAILLLVVYSRLFSQNSSLQTNKTITLIENKLLAKGLGRYMEMPNHIPEPVLNVEGWENDTLQRFEYTIADSFDKTLKATVIMYNADIHRIANWIYFSLLDANKKMNENNINSVITHIRESSGFQFPVRGLVYEDLKGRHNDLKDGINETYFFYDGVSVSHKKIKINTYQATTPERVTSSQMDSVLTMRYNDIDSVFLFARISSTIRKDYKKFMLWKFNEKIPDLDKDKGKAFLKYIQRDYKNAMHGSRNNIIAAWVYSNKEIN